MNPKPCACQVHYGIPAVSAVCGYHAAAVTHTARDGYTLPCRDCAGTGTSLRSDEVRPCKLCDATGRAPVTLKAAKAAREFAAAQREKMMRPDDAVNGFLAVANRVGRAPRRR